MNVALTLLELINVYKQALYILKSRRIAWYIVLERNPLNGIIDEPKCTFSDAVVIKSFEIKLNASTCMKLIFGKAKMATYSLCR